MPALARWRMPAGGRGRCGRNTAGKGAEEVRPLSRLPGLQQLVEDPDIQAVVACLPTATPRRRRRSAAIQARKHVLCEMPLASNLAGTPTSVIAAAHKARRHSDAQPHLPLHPQLREGQGMIEPASSATRRRSSIASSFRPRIWPFSGRWAAGCGNIGRAAARCTRWASRSIDLLRWLSGRTSSKSLPPTKYTPLAQYGGTLGYDALRRRSRFANGMVGSLQYSGSVTHSASSSRSKSSATRPT